MNSDIRKICYLHRRCLRLESCRKALVWQKRYLQRVLSGYHAMERELAPSGGYRKKQRGRFKCVALAVVGMLRMRFLVRRRLQTRAFASAALVRRRDNGSGGGQYTGTSPPNRDPHTPTASAPTHATPTAPPTASLSRRLLKQDLRLHLPSSPGVGEFARRLTYNTSTPRGDPFILSSPRGEAAAAYLTKLELVSRCLSRALDVPRDTP